MSAFKGFLIFSFCLIQITTKITKTSAQSNYVQHGDIGNYSTDGLPEEATLDGKVRNAKLS